MKWLIPIILLSGCTASDVFDNGTDFVTLNPLCIFICIGTLNAADTDSRVGDGGSNSQSTTQTATTSAGGQ